MKDGIKEVLKASEISNEEKRLVEVVIVGGSLRIPLLQSTIEEYLKNIGNEININRTINMDECISYGNSYYGLIKEDKWRCKIVNEEEKDEISQIMSIPQNEAETGLKCLNSVIRELREKRIEKYDNKLLMRIMNDCINEEMNELKNAVDKRERRVDEIKRKIEEMYKLLFY